MLVDKILKAAFKLAQGYPSTAPNIEKSLVSILKSDNASSKIKQQALNKIKESKYFHKRSEGFIGDSIEIPMSSKASKMTDSAIEEARKELTSEDAYMRFLNTIRGQETGVFSKKYQPYAGYSQEGYIQWRKAINDDLDKLSKNAMVSKGDVSGYAWSGDERKISQSLSGAVNASKKTKKKLNKQEYIKKWDDYFTPVHEATHTIQNTGLKFAHDKYGTKLMPKIPGVWQKWGLHPFNNFKQYLKENIKKFDYPVKQEIIDNIASPNETLARVNAVRIARKKGLPNNIVEELEQYKQLKMLYPTEFIENLIKNYWALIPGVPMVDRLREMNNE